MLQFDLSAELLSFHDQYVKLDDIAKKKLAEVRDTNLQRIRDGLGDLSRPVFKDWRNQGGYAMETVVNDPAGESNHDIDVAVIFEKDDLPAGALAARQRVRDAILKRANKFLDEPEARTNAVTVWYADGYHLDFAVYRRAEDIFGNITYEHASTDWVTRDPDEVTRWLNKAVDDKSPAAGLLLAPKVRVRQLRRIVRLVKWFCRSRTSWNLPGGMIASALVVECYRADPDRDDVALYNTLTALKARLDGDCRVYHPLGGGRELTGKQKYLTQVEKLRDRLGDHLPKLNQLFAQGCSREQARGAWDWIFNHTFWAGKEALEEAAAVAKTDSSVSGYIVALGCDVITAKGRLIGPYNGQLLPKNMQLRFYVASTNVPEPYTARFEIKNTGEEARAEKDIELKYEASGYQPEWTVDTAYKGTHRSSVYAVKNGATVASASIVIRIAGGIWHRRRQ
ncbi:MAG: hypothetical protein Q8R82_21680 [Hyphomonadaceae bacterium]|nr:hypothetical protein [Hyphomonadaceae bacterium]